MLHVCNNGIMKNNVHSQDNDKRVNQVYATTHGSKNTLHQNI